MVDFEKERRLVSLGAVEAIRAALERAGIEFIDENGVGKAFGFESRGIQSENSSAVFLHQYPEQGSLWMPGKSIALQPTLRYMSKPLYSWMDN